MAEILHQLIGSLSHHLQGLYIPGGARFLPSTVSQTFPMRRTVSWVIFCKIYRFLLPRGVKTTWEAWLFHGKMSGCYWWSPKMFHVIHVSWVSAVTSCDPFFAGRIGSRISRFLREVGSKGGGNGVDSQYNPESLVALRENRNESDLSKNPTNQQPQIQPTTSKMAPPPKKKN